MRDNSNSLAECDVIQPTFVEPEAFHRLAISNRQLRRRDDRRARLRGLYDAQSGEWFVVEEDRLYAGQ